MALTDERYEHWKIKTHERIMYWRHVLRLEPWRIDIEWMVEGGRNDGSITYMSVGCSWAYQTATIYVYINILEDENVKDDHLEEMIVHELLHLHMNELRAKDRRLRDQEERVVTILSRIISHMQSEHTEHVAVLEGAEASYIERLIEVDKTIHKLRRKVKRLEKKAA